MSELIEQKPGGTCNLLAVSPEDLRTTSKETLVTMLFLLYLVREFETAVLDLHDLGLVHGPAHISIGQEAVAAGMAAALRKSDLVGSTHRAHGHVIAKAFMYYSLDGYDPLIDPIASSAQDARSP